MMSGLTILCPRNIAKRKASNPGVAAVKGPRAHLKIKKITTPYFPRRNLSEMRLEER